MRGSRQVAGHANKISIHTQKKTRGSVSLSAGMINPAQSTKISTLNRKVLLRLRGAVIYFSAAPSTFIIRAQVQARIPLPPRCSLMLADPHVGRNK